MDEHGAIDRKASENSDGDENGDDSDEFDEERDGNNSGGVSEADENDGDPEHDETREYEDPNDTTWHGSETSTSADYSSSEQIANSCLIHISRLSCLGDPCPDRCRTSGSRGLLREADEY